MVAQSNGTSTFALESMRSFKLQFLNPFVSSLHGAQQPWNAHDTMHSLKAQASLIPRSALHSKTRAMWSHAFEHKLFILAETLHIMIVVVLG